MNARRRGFTLLEVLVATTIMAIAVGGVLSALSSSMRNASRLSDYDRAAMFARRKMDELLVDQRLPKAVALEGRWDPAMTNGRLTGWRARVMPWEMTPDAAAEAAILERVELEVWWQEGDRRRTFSLEAYRRGILKAADIEAGALLTR
ncbi:MAG: type II secretion system minor pseudopilin GspI [Bryobacteraceae bacterium]|nr:type II secretion system minor pseudopilin GspI [Bryobacteraceae bacterium]